MTDPERRRRHALHAAASVVLAFHAGCAGSKTPVPPVAPEAGSAGAAATELTARIAQLRMPLQDTCRPDGDMAACCDALREVCAEAFGEDQPAMSACMWGPTDAGLKGCTPWGPPVPPAMT